jgi:dethiobiotin synthetase
MNRAMSRAPLLVVTGTGTGIGKTHVAASLVRAWAARTPASGGGLGIVGLKPIESGVDGSGPTDWETLGQASTFHVTRFRPPYMYALPISPHLAARQRGEAIELANVKEWVDGVRADATGVLVELPGGLFSPLGPGESNASLVQLLEPSAVVLVAPDRLGVLHDVGAATRAARSASVAINGIVLSAPEQPDTSGGTNAAELPLVTDVPVLATFRRAPAQELAREPEAARVLDALLARS